MNKGFPRSVTAAKSTVIFLPHLRKMVRDGGLLLSGFFVHGRLAAGSDRLPHGLARGAADTITFQGDYYNGYDGETAEWPTFTPPDYSMMDHDTAHVSGDNVLLHWRRVLDEQSDWTAKVYYDQTERHWLVDGFAENQDAFDFDFQYRFPLGNRNEVICGTEYRNVRDSTESTVAMSLVPPEVTNNFYSCFVQDQFTVKEDLCYLTVGSKFERDDYTGFEWEPTIRLLLDARQAGFHVAAVSPPSARRPFWRNTSRPSALPFPRRLRPSWSSLETAICCPRN